MTKVVFERLYPDVKLPKRQTQGSAGHDIHAYLKVPTVQVWEDDRNYDLLVREDGKLYIPPRARVLIPTGFRMQLPEGTEAQIRIRSSMALKRGFTIPNAPSTIDSDYFDQVFVLYKNENPHPAVIEHDERIAQLVIAQYLAPEFVEGVVNQTTDRTGGFGSTGR